MKLTEDDKQLFITAFNHWTRIKKHPRVEELKLWILSNQFLDDQVKAIRYDILKDRYLNQNQKHFNELCGVYFDEE